MNKKGKGKKTMLSARKIIGPEKFIRAWQSAENLADAAKKAAMTPVRAKARASAYRKLGINLKKFSDGRRRSKLDVPKLKKLADMCAREVRR